MKTTLEKNIDFEDQLLARCREQFPQLDATAAVGSILNRLEHEGRRQQEIVLAMRPELQRVFGGLQ